MSLFDIQRDDSNDHKLAMLTFGDVNAYTLIYEYSSKRTVLEDKYKTLIKALRTKEIQEEIDTLEKQIIDLSGLIYMHIEPVIESKYPRASFDKDERLILSAYFHTYKDLAIVYNKAVDPKHELSKVIPNGRAANLVAMAKFDCERFEKIRMKIVELCDTKVNSESPPDTKEI